MEYTRESIGKVAEAFLEEVSQEKKEGASLVGFEGELGAGKTTFFQECARVLGIEEVVVSPTFVIAKFYTLPRPYKHIERVVHIDAYRIEDEQELDAIGFDLLVKDLHTLVVVEWPSRVSQSMKKNKGTYYTFSYTPKGRHINGPHHYE